MSRQRGRDRNHTLGLSYVVPSLKCLINGLIFIALLTVSIHRLGSESDSIIPNVDEFIYFWSSDQQPEHAQPRGQMK